MIDDSGEAVESGSLALRAAESAMAELWKETLQTVELPAPTDDFFYLGGDSMTMVMLEFRIAEEFGVALPPGAVLGAPTLRELSALVHAHSVGRERTPQSDSETLDASTLAR